MNAIHSPIDNRLLAALPPADYERLLPRLEHVRLPLGWALHEAGRPQEYVYFPTTAIVSLLYGAENGAVAGIAVCGNEGMVGVSLLMGSDTSSSRAVVQSA